MVDTTVKAEAETTEVLVAEVDTVIAEVVETTEVLVAEVDTVITEVVETIEALVAVETTEVLVVVEKTEVLADSKVKASKKEDLQKINTKAETTVLSLKEVHLTND